MNLFKFHAESMIVSFAVLSDTPQLAILLAAYSNSALAPLPLPITCMILSERNLADHTCLTSRLQDTPGSEVLVFFLHP